LSEQFSLFAKNVLFVQTLSKQLFDNTLHIFDINKFINDTWVKIVSTNKTTTDKWKNELKEFEDKTIIK